MSSPTPTPYHIFVGVDIAATTATATWIGPDTLPPRPITIEQTPTGFALFQRQLLSLGHAPHELLIVMEATGSYWIRLATTLYQAGFAVSVINPAQAHNFAKALLKRAKNDAIDAQTLAQLAALLQPTCWTPPPPIYHEIEQRLAQRDALLDLRLQVRNQLHALLQGPVVIGAVRARMEALITTLTDQIEAVEAELTEAIQQDAEWAAAASRLQSIPGIGPLTTCWLLVTTLNFTTCATVEAATAYAGLAPMERVSGTSVRGRATIGHTGNTRLRTSLYLASMSACRHNPIIKRFYERLRAAGKSKKVARCAAARKLLHIAWAVATKGEPFNPDYQR